MKEAETLREMTTEELLTKRTELKEGILNMSLQKQTGQLEDSDAVRRSRRSVAKVETVLSERRRAAAQAES